MSSQPPRPRLGEPVSEDELLGEPIDEASLVSLLGPEAEGAVEQIKRDPRAFQRISKRPPTGTQMLDALPTLASAASSFLIPGSGLAPAAARVAAAMAAGGAAVPVKEAGKAAFTQAPVKTGEGLAGEATRTALTQGGATLLGEGAAAGIRGVSGVASYARQQTAKRGLAERLAGLEKQFGKANLEKAGTEMRGAMQATKRSEHARVGRALDQAMLPVQGQTVDVSRLLEQLDTLPQEAPLTKEARARLMSFLNPGTTEMPVEKLRQFSMEYGGKIRFNPTRAQSPPAPLREEAEALVESKMDPAQQADYQRAKAQYQKYASTFKRGVVPQQLSPKSEQTPASTAQALFSGKAARVSPKRASAIMESLGGDPAAKAHVRSAVVDADLLKHGIENFPERVGSYDPDVLRIYLGASDAASLTRIAEQVKALRGPAGAKLEPIMGGPATLMLPRLLRYTLATQGAGALGKVSRFLGAAIAGSTRPLSQLIAGMAQHELEERKEERKDE